MKHVSRFVSMIEFFNEMDMVHLHTHEYICTQICSTNLKNYLKEKKTQHSPPPPKKKGLNKGIKENVDFWNDQGIS